MTAARPRPSHASQPELPLGQPPDERHPPGEDGWRLDEHTRQIGLRGVARARARLERSYASADGESRRTGRGPSGRAA